MNLLIIFFVVALLIVFNAFYVAAEFAAVSARRTRISERAEEGQPGGTLAPQCVGEPRRA